MADVLSLVHRVRYYIVTFQTGGRDTARAIVDAFDGTLDELEAVEETGEELTTYLPALRRYSDCRRKPSARQTCCVSAFVMGWWASTRCWCGSRACNHDLRFSRSISCRSAIRSSITVLTANASAG
jgi:hypothetical protein